MNGQAPSVEEAVPTRITTGIPHIDNLLANLSPAAALKFANTMEKYAASVRKAVGSAGFGPSVQTSCWIQGNFYLHLGLSKHQMQRLKQAAKVLLKPKYRTSANMAWFLVNAALSHLEIMETLLCRDIKIGGPTAASNISMCAENYWDQKSRASLKSLN